jgi:hypothetical protein
MNLMNIKPINYPTSCCNYCGKQYKNRKAFEKHTILCDLIQKSKNKKIKLIHDEEEDYIPTPRELYNIINEMTVKYNELNDKYDALHKYIMKEKKRINIIEWLNTNFTPNKTFNETISNLIFPDDIIDSILNRSYMDVILHLLFINFKPRESSKESTLLCFTQKSYTIYYFNEFEPTKNTWKQLNHITLIQLLSLIQMNITKIYINWKKNNKKFIDENEELAKKSDKAIFQIMNHNYNEYILINKIYNTIYNNFKHDLKSLVEYEFTF